MHIGFIMDGNRRWAKSHGLPSLAGHKAGFDTLKKVIDWCPEFNVDTITLYAFSTENWNRADDEVAGLMNIFRVALLELKKLGAKNNRVSIIGNRSQLASDIQKSIAEVEESTKSNMSLHIIVALSYGGRSEILDAIHRIPKERLASLTEEEFSNLLWTSGVPDPDLIVRTGGEQRLSNFLPWQSVYSELKFIPAFWPDFSQKEFSAIIAEYESRHRRFGK